MLSFFLPVLMHGQEDSLFSKKSLDSFVNAISNEYTLDTVVHIDTMVPQAFIGYDKLIFRNSKDNLRKTLSASSNPPIRVNLNNYVVFLWGILVLLMIIFFKSQFALQYRLINKAWFSNINFNEFFTTQTSVFKNSKLLTWLIISQCISIGIYIILDSNSRLEKLPNGLIALGISVVVLLIFTANQWLKSVFAYSFYQPGLSLDYAIIFRIHAYVASLVLLPILMLIYYSGSRQMTLIATIILITYIISVYALSLAKFILSGRFLQNQSNFILILYLCAFEILPLLVMVKSITNLLEYD